MEFKEGDTVYHKATLYRCVVIRINNDGTIKVRDEKNQEQDYYPQELRPEPSKRLASIQKRKKMYGF